MSWGMYMINESKSVHIRVGKVHEEEFLQSVKEINTCLDDIEEKYEFGDIEEIKNKKACELTVKDIAVMARSVLNYQMILTNLEMINPAAIFLYTQWQLEGDKIRFEVDPDLTGKSEEI